MRQDLTVQNIKNEFSVEVYERNARIALEMSGTSPPASLLRCNGSLHCICARLRGSFNELHCLDLFEFNACQTQLWSLYKVVAGARKNYQEFVAYRILYFVHTRNVTGECDRLSCGSVRVSVSEVMLIVLVCRRVVGNVWRGFILVPIASCDARGASAVSGASLRDSASPL